MADPKAQGPCGSPLEAYQQCILRTRTGKMGQPGIHPNVASGDAHIREVLAFRLDCALTLTLNPNPNP